MTSPYVSSAIKNILLYVPGTVFKETVNTRPEDMPSGAIWTSLENDFSKTTRITLGSPATFREEGNVNVLVQVRAGTGTVAIYSAVELIRRSLFGYYDAKLAIDEVDSGTDHIPDDGVFFQVRIPVPYKYDFVFPPSP